MNITITDIIVWLIVGALAGSLTGMVVKRRKKGFGYLANVGIGLVGALLGGILFTLFQIDLGLGQIAVSAEDLIAAIVGSLIFLLILWAVRKTWTRARRKEEESRLPVKSDAGEPPAPRS